MGSDHGGLLPAAVPRPVVWILGDVAALRDDFAECRLLRPDEVVDALESETPDLIVAGYWASRT